MRANFGLAFHFFQKYIVMFIPYTIDCVKNVNKPEGTCLKGLHDQSMCCHDTALQLESIVDSSSKLIEILLDIETADKINDESTDILRKAKYYQ